MPRFNPKMVVSYAAFFSYTAVFHRRQFGYGSLLLVFGVFSTLCTGRVYQTWLEWLWGHLLGKSCSLARPYVSIGKFSYFLILVLSAGVWF